MQLFEINASFLFPQFSFKQITETPAGLRAKINIEGNTYLFILLVCKRPYPSEMNSFLERVRTEKYNFLFLGTYFPPGTQNFLEKAGVNFLDLSGNCFINVTQRAGSQKHNVHIRMSGKQNLYPSTELLKNVFSGRSSRIVRTLLETYPQKFKPLQLANMCRVSPALVTRVIEALEQRSFVSRKDELSLIDPGLLLDQWADSYQFRKNSLESRFFINKPLNEILRLFTGKEGFALTRSAAASLIAPFADYQVIEIYQKENADIISVLEQDGGVPLDNAKGANVNVLVPYDNGVFDFCQSLEDLTTVGLIQLYLDLYSDPRRGKEQAAFLRERRLKF